MRDLDFRRTLHQGMTGRDVWAVQHALKHGTNPQIRPAQPTGHYGKATVHQVRELQKRRNLHQTGIIGEHTWNTACKPMMHRDDYATWIWHRLDPVNTWEDKLRSFCIYTYQHRSQLHYDQVRPMSGMVCPPSLDTEMDCSEGATLAYKCAGLPDPNGYGYNGIGNTSTLMANGKHVSLADLRVGDLVFYAGPWHVAVAISHSQVWSNGSEDAPFLLPPAYRSIYTIRRYQDPA